MSSFVADPIARVLNLIELDPENEESLYPFNLTGGPNSIGTIIVAAGMHEDNIRFLKNLYDDGARRTGKTKLTINFIFEDRPSVFRPHSSVDRFIPILEGVLQSPRCFCPTVQVDGVVKENFDASIRVAASCRCNLLRLTQCFGNELLLETVHLNFLLENSPALCIELSVPVPMADYEGLADRFSDTWSVFVRPDELQLIAFRGEIRNENDFVSAAIEVGLSRTEERAINLLHALKKF